MACALLPVTLASCTPDVAKDGSCSLGFDRYGLPRCNVTEQYVLTRPGVSLEYPDSQLVARTGNDQFGLMGDALVTSTYRVRADAPAILAWYRQNLEQLGLSVEDVGPAPVVELRAPRGARESLTVVVRVATVGFTPPPGLPSGVVEYEVSDTISPAQP